MTDTLPNAMNCTHCGTAPEMRRDESRGLFMPACPQCKFHAEPCLSLIHIFPVKYLPGIFQEISAPFVSHFRSPQSNDRA